MIYCVVASENNLHSTSTTPSSGSTIDDATQKFLPYLQEIQRKLFTLLIVLVGGAVLGFVFNQKILTAILGLFNFNGISLVLTSPYQFFDLAVNTGLATGFIAAFLLFIYYTVGFLRPALSPQEFLLLKRIIPFTIVLFIVGFGFGAWVMQFVIGMFSQTAIDFKVSNMWDISKFFSQTIIIGLCLGMMFELPVVVTLLIRFKIIKKQVIVKCRRFVYAAIIILAAFLPPNDVISLSILTLVPVFLFEFALLLNKSR